jgi:hypothetical protein
VDDELGTIRKESVVTWFEILSQHALEATENLVSWNRSSPTFEFFVHYCTVRVIYVRLPGMMQHTDSNPSTVIPRLLELTL